MDTYSLLFSYLQDDLQVQHTYAECIKAPCLLQRSYVARCALLDSIYKKLLPLNNDNLEAVAVDTFRYYNDKCKEWTAADTGFLSRVRARLDTILAPWHDYDWIELLTDAHLIPCSGASVKSKGQNSAFEKLFVNSWTYTDKSLVKDLMRCYARWNPRLLLAEQNRRSRSRDPLVLVRGSTLSTVPKNSSTNRTICTEPGINMLYQRALGECLNDALSMAFGYDPALQPDRNRRQARDGVDKGYATIDLRSASDSISLGLCEAILPRWLNTAISDCRSPVTCYNGIEIELSMVSSMGNGFTFPLQTLIFTAILYQVAQDLRIRPSSFKREAGFGVFGDDIICPSRMYDVLCMRLEECGFSVNREKSYNTGLFRESCGGDFYDGEDVRGVYCRSLATHADVFSLINRLTRWGAKHGVLLVTAVPYLVSLVPPYHVPFDEADTAGIHMPRPDKPALRMYRYRCLRPCLTKFSFVNKDGALRRSHDNPHGFLYAMLLEAWPHDKGHVDLVFQIIEARSCTETVRRSRATRFRPVWEKIPFWGTHTGLVGSVNYLSWERYHDLLWSVIG